MSRDDDRLDARARAVMIQLLGTVAERIEAATALPVALPFWGGFRRIRAVTGGKKANEFAVSGLF
jgi:hypothetical protein